MPGPVIGRETELDSIVAFVRSTGAGPGVLLLEGDAGIGKTTLWNAAQDAIGEEPRQILRTQPAETERELPFAGLGDLLRDHADTVLPDLPSPQRRALEVALLLKPAEGRGTETRAVAAGCLGALRALAREGPLLVAIDDAQWLDPPSARALAFALRRLTAEPIRFLVAERLEPNAGPALGLSRPPAGLELTRLRLGQLSLAAVQQLLRIRLSTTFTRPVLRRIHETSGGNPFFALELARALDGLESPGVGEPLPVPDQLRLLVLRRLASLPQRARDVLLGAALLGQPDLLRLEAAMGAVASEALQPAVDTGIVKLADGRIRFEHPLLSSVLVEGAHPRVRRALHKRLAEVVEEPEERTRHLGLAAGGPDESIAARLDVAAGAVATRGAQEAAAGFAEQAFRLTPPASTEKLAERAVAAGWYAWLAGDGARGRRLLEEHAIHCPSGSARARALLKLVRLHLWVGNRGAIPDLVAVGLAESGNDPALRAAFYEILAWALLIGREDLAEAARLARTAVRLAEAIDDPVQLCDALAAQAQSEFLLGGGLPSAPMERALALPWEDLSERAMRDPRLHWSLMLQCADRLDEAREQLTTVRANAHAHGDESALAWISMRLCHVELQAGDWAIALAHADEGHAEALQTGQEAQAGVLLCTRALVVAHLGRVQEARAAAKDGMTRAEQWGDRIATRIGEWALGHLALALGDPAEAQAVLGRLWRDGNAAGIVDPGENRYAGDLVEALAMLGRLDEAEAVTATLESRGRSLGRPAVLAVAARCRGILAGARGRHEAAVAHFGAALEHHDRVPLPFERARTLLGLGSAQRAVRHRRDARASLDQARHVFETLGAMPWALRAAEELGRIGGRAPSSGGLTPSENRVAELVAEGRTNREVAAALVIAERTVETHLSHIYRKLGLRSRTQLARKVQ